MLNRRHLLLASIAAGVTMSNRTVLAKASQPSTPVNFEVPAGAVDCHTHIHGDPAKFPFFAGRVYTPEPASPEEMAALHKALHIQRVVIVTPSVYGPDNSATLFGMKARGNDARGVAVIDDKTTESDLDAMGQGRHSRHPDQSRHQRRQRSQRRTRAPSEGDRAHEGARLAYPGVCRSAPVISAIKDLIADRADAHRVRPFRRRGGRARPGTAGFCGSAGAGEIRQGVCENLGRLPALEARAPTIPTPPRSPAR